MNHVTKLPPPDSVGNIRGRIAQLRAQAHNDAWGSLPVDEADKGGTRTARPEDYDKRLEAAFKKFAPQFKKLERRLKKCPKEKVVTQADRDAAKKAAKPPTPKKPKKPKKPADTRERAKVNGRKTSAAAAVLDGGTSQEPLSREGALTEGVAQDQKPDSDILDFMQGTLD